MKEHQHSRTAEAAAGLRAIHRRIDRPRVFDDPWALDLTSDAMRRLARTGPMLRLLLRDPLGLSAAARGHIVGRSRFAEDHLADAVRRGFSQYVIIGAGLDSFAARRPPDCGSLRVFELDHPATQAAKRRRMIALAGDGVQPPDYVPIDFEQQSLDEALGACANFDASRPAFFSWLGTTPYLSRDAIFASLAAIARVAAAGSEIALDFAVAHRQVDGGRDRLQGLALLAYTRLLSEPLIDNGLSQEEFLAQCAKLRLRCLECLDAQAVRERYFTDSRPPLASLPNTCFAHFVLETSP